MPPAAREIHKGEKPWDYGPGRRAFNSHSGGADMMATILTIRALAGLVYRCGLLQRESISTIDTALSWYGKHYASFDRDGRAAYRAKVDAYRRKHSRPCNVRFLGVWDTVKSVGYLKPVNLPHTRHNPIIFTARHALSLDERRSSTFRRRGASGSRTHGERCARRRRSIWMRLMIRLARYRTSKRCGSRASATFGRLSRSSSDRTSGQQNVHKNARLPPNL
jgi:uncharacterized protein (DUF2235 family)